MAAIIRTDVRSVRDTPVLPNGIVTMNYADVDRDDGEGRRVDTSRTSLSALDGQNHSIHAHVVFNG